MRKNPRLIDLSQNITDNMAVHPYDDSVRLYQDKHLAEDGYNNFRLEIGMHAGTHIDTPMHLTDRQTFINEISLDRFTGRGCMLDVRDRQVIGLEQEYTNIVQEDDIVLLFTNYSDRYGTEEYFTDHPIVHKELVDFLVYKKIKMLGMDLPSPDRYPFLIHKQLLSNDILIIENLTNLARLLNSAFEILAFPLKIKAEASMARVIARIHT